MTQPHTDIVQKRSNSEQAGRALCQRIEHYFQPETLQAEAIDVTVEATLQAPYEEGRGVVYALRFTLPEGHTLDGHVQVEHTGGNMYTAEAGLEAQSEQFSLSLQEPAMAAEESYGRELCAYLVEEVKRRAGEVYLREASSGSRPEP